MAVEKIYHVSEYTIAEAGRILRSRTSTAEERSAVIAQIGEEKARELIAQTHDNDENGYDVVLDDETKANSRERGKKTAAAATNHDGSGESAANLAPTVLGGAGAAGVAIATNLSSTGIGSTISVELAKKAKDKIANKAAKKAAKEGFNQGTKQAGKEAAKKVAVGDIITVGITTATLGMYAATKPNSDEHEASEVLRTQELPTAISDLHETQGNIEDTAAEIQEQTEEAEALKDGAAEAIEENKVVLEVHKARAEELKAKKATNVALTQDERAELKTLNKEMTTRSEAIGTTSEDANDEIGDIHADITDKQSDFDDAAETMSEVQGLTDFSDGFTKSGEVTSYVEAGAMGLNSASATAAGAKILAKSAFSFGTTTAIGLLGIATGVGSAAATTQQIGYAKDFSAASDLSEEVQGINNETNDFYEEELDNFVGAMDYVENDLVVDIPDDVEINDVNAPAEGEESSPSIMDIANENDKKKKDKNNKNANNGVQTPQYQLNFGNTVKTKAADKTDKQTTVTNGQQNQVNNDKKAEEEKK